MKIRTFSILNYKSAQQVNAPLNPDEVNTFIGINDCGKSTILQALGLFFQEKPTVSFQTESSQKTVLSHSRVSREEFANFFQDMELPVPEGYEEDLICVYVQFETEKVYTYDELKQYSAQLQCCLDSKPSGEKVNLLRIFNADGSKNKHYILNNDFENNDSEPYELWNQTEKTVKDVQAKHGVSDEAIKNRNEVGNPEKTERILAILRNVETTQRWSVFDFKKDLAAFPEYRYLDWNTDANELNDLAAAVMQPIISSLVGPLQSKVNTESEGLNIAVNEELQKLYDEFKADLPESIQGISANVSIALQKSVTELFVQKHSSDQQIHIEEQGDGIKRQIKLGLLKALAQKNSANEDNTKEYIWCFDEPETHLFPKAQRDLARSLASLASAQFQILVGTHSTLFVDRSRLANITQVSLEGGYSVLRSTHNTEDIYQALGVRNSDFLFFNRFIAVEGATEMGVLDHFYRTIYGSGLADDGIQLINLGGETNANVCVRLLDNIFSDFQRPDDIVVYLFDKDTGRSGENVFLVGEVANLEDEINNDVWVSAIDDSCSVKVSVSTLDEIRLRIVPKDRNKTMHSLLSKHISSETGQAERLPDKGPGLSELLTKHIDDEAKIPQSIRSAFSTVRKGL
jgi:predicted ATP-dependent endonuclease of OLD family